MLFECEVEWSGSGPVQRCSSQRSGFASLNVLGHLGVTQDAFTASQRISTAEGSRLDVAHDLELHPREWEEVVSRPPGTPYNAEVVTMAFDPSPCSDRPYHPHEEALLSECRARLKEAPMAENGRLKVLRSDSTLGVRGVLIRMTKRGHIVELRCEMPTCPKGRRYFDPWPDQRTWTAQIVLRAYVS